MAGSKEAAKKARQTTIDRYYDGDEEKYLQALRERGGRGGLNGGRPFRDIEGLAKKASDKAAKVRTRKKNADTKDM